MNKRRLLEIKLKKRKESADFRLEKTRSKLLQKLHDQELRLFTEEAFRLSDIVDRFEFNQNLVADNLSQESLEWDNSEEVPSFLTATSNSDPSVEEIIEDIFAPHSPTEGDLLDPLNLAVLQEKFRRKTSTDPDFLEDPEPESSENTRYTYLNWPSRFPSAEPEVFSPLYSSTTNLELLSEEVFDTETAVTGSMMEEVNFKARLKAVNIAERKVNLGVKQFLAVNLTEVDVTNYGDGLKEIRNKLDFYNDTAIELICDLDAFDVTDQPRIANLEKQQDDLSDSVVRNEKDVKEKIKELLAAQPMSQAEKETLELKKRQISVEDDEKKNAKADKAKKILIDMDDISSRCKSLLEIIFDINKATDLSDQDVRQHLLDSKRWETKLEDIVSSKVKVDKDIVGVDVDSETVGKLKDIVEKVKTSVRGKVAELKKVDVKQ